MMMKFPTEETLVLKISILPLNFPTVQSFQAQILYFWKKIFGQEETFLTGLLFRGIAPPLAMTPLSLSGEEIWVLKISVLSLKLPQTGEFQPEILWVFLKKTFRRETSPTGLRFRGIAPPYRDAIESVIFFQLQRDLLNVVKQCQRWSWFHVLQGLVIMLLMLG